MNSEVLDLLLYIGIPIILFFAIGYFSSFGLAHLRDRRHLPPKTIDLRGLDNERPNVSLWWREQRIDPQNIGASLIKNIKAMPSRALAFIKSLLSSLRTYAIIAACIIAVLVGIALLIFGGSAVFSALGSAPGWAVIIIILLVILVLK